MIKNFIFLTHISWQPEDEKNLDISNHSYLTKHIAYNFKDLRRQVEKIIGI